jgi:hypothetical protein
MQTNVWFIFFLKCSQNQENVWDFLMDSLTEGELHDVTTIYCKALCAYEYHRKVEEKSVLCTDGTEVCL